MWNTVLFDLDGTLTDSGEGITRCAQYALYKVCGLKVDDLHELDDFVGPPLKDSFMAYADMTEEEADRAVMAYRERYTTTGIYENRLYEGIGSLLASLAQEGFRIGLASSKPTEFCIQILRFFGIADYFSVVVGSELNGARVRKSEVIEEALKRIGMSGRRSEVVLIGDRKYDVEGAKQAGISSIGVTYGYGSREELERAWPDCIVDSTEELRNVLVGQLRAEKGRVFCDARYGTSPFAGRAFETETFGWKIWRIVYPVLIDLGISNAISFVIGLLIGMVYSAICLLQGRTIHPEEISSFISGQIYTVYAFVTALTIPIFIILFKKDEERRALLGRNDLILQKRGISPAAVFLILLLTVCFTAPLNAVAGLLPDVNGVYQSMVESMNMSSPFVILIAISIMAPVSEELIFRGIVYRRARDYFGVVPAVLISGILFALMHGNLQQGFVTLFAGMLMAVLYEHYGTLAAPLIVHVFNNFSATFIDKYVSPMIPDGAGLILNAVSILLSLLIFWLIFVRDRKVNRI